MSGVNTRLWLNKTAVACLLATVVVASAQTAPANGPFFDISSVKWNKSGSHSTHIHSNDELYLATNVSLKSLLESAYGIKMNLISGLPPWAKDARFDIEAKVLDPSTVAHIDTAQREAMIRRLLEDRFHLKAHTEPKTLPVFELVVAKSGSKLTPSPPDPTGTRDSGIHDQDDEIDAHDLTPAALAEALTRQVDRTVIDKTGLTGKFDFKLKFGREDNAATAHADGDDLPSIFTAVEEQLGLKLQPGKGPVDTLVVDQVDQPSEN